MQLSRSTVNFVPENLILEQKTKSQAFTGLKVAIIICILCCAVYGGIFFFNLLKQREITAIETNIKAQKDIITNLEEFGKKGYKLGVRLGASKDVINQRNLYSRLINELNNKVIDTIAITDVSFTSPTAVIVSGEALSNYAPIGEYTQKLLENKAMFEDIKINSAQGSGEEEAVKFTLNIKLKSGGLNESVN